MRIMEIIGEAEGGMKEHYMLLTKGFIEKGAEVIAICNFTKEDITELKSSGIQVVPFPFPKTLRPFSTLWRIIRLIYHIKMLKPHVIHCHGFKAGFIGRLAGLLDGSQIPLIYTVHNFTTFGRGRIQSQIIRYFEQWIAEKTKRIIPVSKALRTFLSRDMEIPEEKLHVIYNAVPALPEGDGNAIRERYSIRDDEWIVGTVARLIPSKGIHVLLTAMSGILFKYPHVKLIVVGSGPEENQLKKLADNLGISKQTVFVGKVSNVQDYYASFNIFALPTFTEGLGITLLEAMYYELPIIATPVGGIPEWLSNEKNAILVPPDNVFALRTALLTYLENPEFAKKYGRQAKLDIQEKGLSEEEMIKQTWLLLSEIS